MRVMSGARAREAAPLIYFMLIPHCRVSAAGLPWIHLTPFIHSFGASPLHLAAERGHSAIVRLLVSAGADLNIRDV